MRGKNLIILAAVVVAVLAYIMLVERRRPSSEESGAEAEKVLRDFDRDRVAVIVIDRNEGRVRLEKAGEEWHLREPLDFPADSSVVNSTLGSLANLKADRRLAMDDVQPEDYGLEAPVAKVTMRMADGAERSIMVGDELPLGSNRALRVDDGGEVIIASGFFVSDLEREIDEWRSRDVANILEDNVASIDIETGPDSIRAVRLEDRWQLLRPLDDMADGDHLGTMVSELNSMRIVEFLDDDADPLELGLDLPEYEITIVRVDGGMPLRLDLGVTRESDTGTEVACRRGDGEYFWASERVRTRLSKAPVLWRSAKVMPFETWDAEGIRITTPEGSTSLVHDGNFWRFDDETEAKLTAVQDKLRSLAELEATDFDLMAPLTRQMGTVEVVFKAEDGESEAEVFTFSFFAPLSDGGKAMVQVSGRATVMGVKVVDVDSILMNLEDLRSELPQVPVDDSE